MLKETHKQIYFAEALTCTSNQKHRKYNLCLLKRTTPSYVKRRLANKQHRRKPKRKQKLTSTLYNEWFTSKTLVD